MNAVPKYAFSRTLTKADWNNTTLVTGDAAAEVAKLKQGSGKDINVFGSADFSATLMRHRLIDEFHLHVFPVLLGSGRRLFADGTIPAGLKMVDSKTSKTGVFSATYVPAGELVTGTFGG